MTLAVLVQAHKYDARVDMGTQLAYSFVAEFLSPYLFVCILVYQ